MKQILFCISLGLLTQSCGIKGDPLPPMEVQTIQKQELPQNAPAPTAENSETSTKTTKKKRTK